jgi:hypothetical protein
MFARALLAAILASVSGTLLTDVVAADPPAAKNADPAKTAPTREELYKRFSAQMSGVKLVGRFTVLGKENEKLAAEEYRILSVVKMDDGDYWLLTARIKYGKNDVTVPMPLQIKWAGETPVITLDKVTIPGLGTFSSRVLFHENMYAGTWMHDKVGGHLFGTVEKLKPEELEAEKKTPAGKP